MPVLCYHLDGSGGSGTTSTTAQNRGAALETKPQQTAKPAQTESETKPQPTTARSAAANNGRPAAANNGRPAAADNGRSAAADNGSAAGFRSRHPHSPQALPRLIRGRTVPDRMSSSGSSSSGGPGSGSNGTQSSPGGPGGSIRLWREQFTWSIPDTGAGKLSRNGAVKKISN